MEASQESQMTQMEVENGVLLRDLCNNPQAAAKEEE
jgi:hypothetical protein